MTKKITDLLRVSLVGACFAAAVICCWISPSRDFSLSERRKLAQMPKISPEAIMNGKFMKEFESYAQDQFPMRDGMRAVAAVFSGKILGKTDYHDIYLVDGNAAKLDFPLQEDSIKHAANRFGAVYQKYLAGNGGSVYSAVVPDKSFYLAEQTGYPLLDYDRLLELLEKQMPYASRIDLFGTLDADSYYTTDPHWRQEKIQNTATALAEGMGVTLSDTYEKKELDIPYAGTYAGQYALPMPTETIYYMTSDTLENCEVFNQEAGKETTIYDMEKGLGKDPYELFLSGPVSLITIKNPAQENGKRLIVFRDSFGSSIVPYLAEAYSEIVLIDIRYIQPEYLGRFVDFENADTLFLYCASVLNHSETIK